MPRSPDPVAYHPLRRPLARAPYELLPPPRLGSPLRGAQLLPICQPAGRGPQGGRRRPSPPPTPRRLLWRLPGPLLSSRAPTLRCAHSGPGATHLVETLRAIRPAGQGPLWPWLAAPPTHGPAPRIHATPHHAAYPSTPLPTSATAPAPPPGPTPPGGATPALQLHLRARVPLPCPRSAA